MGADFTEDECPGDAFCCPLRKNNDSETIAKNPKTANECRVRTEVNGMKSFEGRLKSHLLPRSQSLSLLLFQRKLSGEIQ